MTQVTIHEAKTNLSRLIRQVLAGEEVVIARGKRPLVKLVVLEEARPPRRLGGASSVVHGISDDFDAPLDDFDEYTR